MSIQYTVLGFEPTTFGARVSSHNHWTRAPTLTFQLFHEHNRASIDSFLKDKSLLLIVDIELQ